MFCSLLSTLCFWSLCMFCFQFVSQFVFYLMCYVLFYVLLMLRFCLNSELCCVLVLCFCYVSVLCLFLLFPLCFWLNLVYVLFFYVSVMCVMLVCFLLCFLLSFHSVLQSFFCSICIVLNSDLFSSVFLLGFCLYVLWQHQICSSFVQFSNLPSQLASELGSLQLVSQVCRGKTSWTNTGQFQFRIRASKILRPPVPWCTSVLSSARLHRQKNCRAPPGPSQRDPVWKPLDSKETVSTKWANLEDRS